MNAPSFKSLVLDKTLKRADALKAKLQDLHEEPGFNWRREGDDLEASISDLANFLASGGQVPDVEVRVRPEGGFYIVDGHRRRRAFNRLAESFPESLADYRDKEGQVWISIKPFTGTEAERRARVMTSQNGRPLSALEIAIGYKGMVDDLNLGPEQIAKLVHKTRQHVDQMLILASADGDVHDMVASGAVSATTAVQVARKNGDKAGQMLKEAAAASKKGKVTGAEMKPWTPPTKRVPDLVTALDDMEKSLPPKTRLELVNLEKEQRLAESKVLVNAGTLWQLLQLQEELAQLREEKAVKEAQKAEKAKQLNIAENAD